MESPGGMSDSRRKRATCHPDQWQHSRGLCHSCYNRTWDKEHPERAREIEKKKRSVNAVKRHAHAHEYYLANSEKILAKNLEYRVSNIEKVRAKKNAYSRTEKGRYNYLRNQAKARELACGISFSDYCELIKKPCFYCGGVLPKVGGGLDRIDSSIGYVFENVKPCCQQCNAAKNVYTEAEFREWASRLFGSEWFKSSTIALEVVA